MSDLIKFNDLDKVKMMVSNRKQEWIELIKNAEINIHQKIELKNQAHTIDKYLQGKRDCESARDDLWEVSEWALKKIGEDLKKLKQEGVIDKGGYAPLCRSQNSTGINLSDLNLTKNESSTAQARAEIPDEEYQATLDALKDKGKANASAVTKYANDKRKKEESEKKKIEKEKIIIAEAEKKEIDLTDIKKGWHKLGRHFLYFGDNTDQDFIDFLPFCKLAFADPPYNADAAEWDNNFKWRQDYLQDRAGVVVVTPGGWNAFDFYRETNMNYVWEIACWIKNGMTHGRCGYQNWIKSSVFSKNKVRFKQDHFFITIKTSETEDTKHKGRKPYEYMREIIDLFTEKNDLIVDPFAGSGTTLIMSERMDRVSYNAEIDKQFCIDIIKRAIYQGLEYEYIS
jgi:hypothetical protein